MNMDETIKWLRDRAETQDRRGESDAARDNRELADLAERRRSLSQPLRQSPR